MQGWNFKRGRNQPTFWFVFASPFLIVPWLYISCGDPFEADLASSTLSTKNTRCVGSSERRWEVDDKTYCVESATCDENTGDWVWGDECNYQCIDEGSISAKKIQVGLDLGRKSRAALFTLARQVTNRKIMLAALQQSNANTRTPLVIRTH